MLRRTLFFVGLAAVAACDVPGGDDSPGEQGVLRFAFSSPQCPSGCSLDRSALLGATVTVIARGEPLATKDVTATLASTDVATVSATRLDCECVASGAPSRPVDRSAPCAEGATKECRVSVDVETTAEGDARLELREEGGALVDAVLVKVRPAIRVESRVRVSGVAATAQSGTYVVKVGQKVSLRTRVFVAGAGEAVFGERSLFFDYADRTILQPDARVPVREPGVEYMVAARAGSTSVTTTATGASSTVQFRVE